MAGDDSEHLADGADEAASLNEDSSPEEMFDPADEEGIFLDDEEKLNFKLYAPFFSSSHDYVSEEIGNLTYIEEDDKDLNLPEFFDTIAASPFPRITCKELTQLNAFRETFKNVGETTLSYQVLSMQGSIVKIRDLLTLKAST